MNEVNVKKKFPSWLKVVYIIVGSFFLLIITIVILTSESPEIKTWDQWKKHKEYLKSFSENVTVSMEPLRVYAKANDYWNDSFYKRCNLDACSEYKGFIRFAREASSDGIITPKELVDMATYQANLIAVIKSKDIEFKNKFKVK